MNNEQIVQKVTEHEMRLDNLENEHKDLKAKVDDIHDIATSVKIMANDITYIKTDIAEVKEDQKDTKKWQKDFSEKLSEVETAPMKETAQQAKDLRSKIIWLILAGVIGFLLAQAFPNIF